MTLRPTGAVVSVDYAAPDSLTNEVLCDSLSEIICHHDGPALFGTEGQTQPQTAMGIDSENPRSPAQNGS